MYLCLYSCIMLRPSVHHIAYVHTQRSHICNLWIKCSIRMRNTEKTTHQTKPHKPKNKTQVVIIRLSSIVFYFVGTINLWIAARPQLSPASTPPAHTVPAWSHPWCHHCQPRGTAWVSGVGAEESMKSVASWLPDSGDNLWGQWCYGHLPRLVPGV